MTVSCENSYPQWVQLCDFSPKGEEWKEAGDSNLNWKPGAEGRQRIGTASTWGAEAGVLTCGPARETVQNNVQKGNKCSLNMGLVQI